MIRLAKTAVIHHNKPEIDPEIFGEIRSLTLAEPEDIHKDDSTAEEHENCIMFLMINKAKTSQQKDFSK